MSGEVARDASLGVETLTIDSASKIGGDLWYESSSKTNIPSDSVAGKVVYQKAEQTDGGDFWLSTALFSIASTILITVIVVLIAPRFVHTAAVSQP